MLRLDFRRADSPRFGIYDAAGAARVELGLRTANMRQIGEFMDAEEALEGGATAEAVARRIETATALSPEEIVDIVWRKGEAPTLVGGTSSGASSPTRVSHQGAKP